MAGTARSWRLLPWGLLLVGIALRLLAITRFAVSADAAEYAVLGRSILEGRGMWLPRGEAWDLDAWTPGPSHHYPPAYPAHLAPFLATFGFTPFAVQVAAFVAGGAPLLVFFIAAPGPFGPGEAASFVALPAPHPPPLTPAGSRSTS